MSQDISYYHTQFYVVLPADLPDNAEEIFSEVVAYERVVSVMIELAIAQKNKDRVQKLIGIAQDNHVAVLLGVTQENWEEGVDLLKTWQCDGLHLLESDSDVKAVRTKLGEDYILGSFCGLSRHKSMQQGEAGADYVAVGLDDTIDKPQKTSSKNGQEIDQIISFIQWYMEMFEVPLVAWDCTSVTMAEKFIRKGVDFVSISDIVWDKHVKLDEVLPYLEELS